MTQLDGTATEVFTKIISPPGGACPVRARMASVAGVAMVAMLAIGASVVAGCSRHEPSKPKGSNAYQRVTGDDSEEDRSHWDALYNTRNYVYGTKPAVFLEENVKLLPVGRALDIAMAEGRNAVYLAKKGFSVDGVDYSEVALRKARRLAAENHVTINTINADLNHYQIRPEYYDVIVNINYLQRSLIPQIKRGLRKGGIVVFENYTTDQLGNSKGQQLARDFLLEKGELARQFSDFKIIITRETNDGKDAVASLIAQKQ